ncbi:hypothetical protein ACIBCR_04530 [Micromonospora echinospora]|uniref:hypothetical protein n=1 Tax=Micromonospora echinospora TaxID=1877 RepID=UPI0037A42677
MPPVVLGCPRWWSVRRALRVFTNLAVAVALALSGGLAGGLPSGSPPGPAEWFPVDRGALVATAQAAHRVPGTPPLAGPVAHDVWGLSLLAGPVAHDVRAPSLLSGPVAGSATSTLRAAGPDTRHQTPLVATGPAAATDAPPAGPGSTGHRPVEPLAATDAGVVGSRAPPRR